ncbi:MAG: endonuclease/exonuclease/phosphatase family protein [Alphaproteobacteria bacterium]|nr:MAG: endonuclease/exonuclease/phosphatase family protein [Alphaproteobacteria bacterium]
MLKILQCNVWAFKAHNGDNFLNLIKRMQPHVVCVQELRQQDISALANAMDIAEDRYVTVPEQFCFDAELHSGIFSRLPLTHVRTCGHDGKSVLPVSDTLNQNLACATVQQADGTGYRFVTAHMGWTPEGEVTPAQVQSVHRLVQTLKQEEADQGNVVFMGDLNAPRGRPAFDLIGCTFTDHIPTWCDNSLDPSHPAAHKPQRMVDGVFTSRHLQVQNVQLHADVSDHQAVTGLLSQA